MTGVVQPAGNHYDKYHTRNPIARWLVAGFLEAFQELALAQPQRTAVEVGCGEGELCQRMHRAGFDVRGFDIADEAIAEANRRAAAAGLRIPFAQASLDELAAQRVRAPLLVCCEVLEHLPDPERCLGQLIEMADPWLLVSVPREPVWRMLNLCRGRYLRDLGNTPGHVNHWSARAFIRLLRARTTVVAVRRPLPWTMALCRVR